MGDADVLLRGAAYHRCGQLSDYYRRFVEAYAELAAQLTTLGSPKARFAYTQASFDAPNLKPAQLRRCITHFRVEVSTPG
jgi:hypothetical protein